MGLRIVFMGTPDFSVGALKSLIAGGHDVVAVYSQPPRPKGRGQQVQKSPVHEVADAHNIPVHTPKSLRKSAEAVEEFLAYKADLAVVAAYGLLLPKAVLDGPKYGCLNIHASILPRWRGAAPIQYAIWKGDAESGVTIMQMEEGLDTGPMILKGTTPITAETTTPLLHDALAQIGADLIVQAAAQLETDGNLPHEVQNDALSNYASMLKKDDGKLDFNQSAFALDLQIRALNPWPGTFAYLQNGTRFKVHSATPAKAIIKGSVGEVTANGEVICGDGTVLQLHEIQPDNGKRMAVQAAFNGKILQAGDVFAA